MGPYVLQQLGYGAPLMFIYLVGIILSAVFVRKYPLPAMLTLAACVILFLNIIGTSIMHGYLIQARLLSGWTIDQYSQMTMVVSIIGALFRTLGTALLVAAVFVGRKPKPAS